MNYQTFQPQANLSSIVKCYWTLEVPAEKDSAKQRILPDGCIELFFILGDEVRRFTSENEFIIQPRQMVLGQITSPFFIQPTGYVNTFAVRFYPYSFANFVTTPIHLLADKETPIELLFGKELSHSLTDQIINATDTTQRIQLIEDFLLAKLTTPKTIDTLVKSTVDTLLSAKGSLSITTLLETQHTNRRQLERLFSKQIGISPKQLGKVIRLQAVIKMLLSKETEPLTAIAYEREYHDQAHFTKDFKEFTGTSPRHFLGDKSLELSALLYAQE